MKTTLILFVFLLTAVALADAQVAPEATAGAANFQYALRYAQTAAFFGDSHELTSQRGTASGSLVYANGGIRLPFSAKLGGGYTWLEGGSPYGTGFFENLLLSQGIVWRKTQVTIGDNVSYRPQAPITGFSGIPGIGESVGGSGDEPSSDESILTQNTHVVFNVANAQVTHILDYATTLSAGGSMSLMRYPDGDGLSTNTEMGNATVSRRLNARNSLNGTYEFSKFAFPDDDFSFTTDTVLGGESRRWNRHLSTNVSAGPEWVSGSNSSIVPSSLRVSGNAAVNYQFQSEQFNLNYSHGTSGGSGFLLGAELDNVTVGLSRKFGRTLTVGLDSFYRRTSGLVNNGVTNSKGGEVQATWQLSRSFSAFANYTGTDQSSSSNLSPDVVSGLIQTIGFGIAYSPTKKRVMGQ